MIYTQHCGSDSFVTVPRIIDNEICTGIGAKAFLSRKEIRRLVLPDTVTEIGDWAFAHMQNLAELTLPAGMKHLGRKVFLDCGSLQQIHVSPDHSGNPGLPFFLAAAVTVFDDMGMFRLEEAASSDKHMQWMTSYDERLTQFLQEEDLLGFEPVFYGWFNDEDADSSQKPAYLKKKRQQKVGLAFLRLRYDKFLAAESRKVLQDFLRDHMPWGRAASDHTMVWDMLPQLCGREVGYCPIMEEAGLLETEHLPQLIGHLAQGEAEVLAWLLRYQEKYREKTDFFDNFSL